MDEEPVIKEEPYSDGELDPLQMNSEAAVDSEVSHKDGVGQLCFVVMLTDSSDQISDEYCPDLMFCLVAGGMSCDGLLGRLILMGENTAFCIVQFCTVIFRNCNTSIR